MANRRHIYSRDFPPSYGDVQLVSSNNVSFYLPRRVLARQCPSFDEFARMHDGVRLPTISLSEHSTLIHLVLRIIDPNKQIPSLEYVHMHPVLQLGRKYAIPMLRDWVICSMTRQYSRMSQVSMRWSTVQAIDYLEIGTTHSLPLLSRFALRILVKAPSSGLVDPRLSRCKLFKHLMVLRSIRVEWFQHNLHRVLEGILLTLPRGSFRRQRQLVSLGMECEALTQVVMSLAFDVASEPSYQRCARRWPDTPYGHYLKTTVQTLMKEKAMRLEVSLPPLPN